MLSLATWPTRSKIAGARIEQAELRAAEDTLRLAADTRKAYIGAVAAREILATLTAAKASADASAMLTGKLTETGAVNTLNHARAQVFATELDAQVMAARQQAAAQRSGSAGSWVYGARSSERAAERVAAVAGEIAQPYRRPAGGDGPQGRSRRGATRGRGARPILGLTRSTRSSMCSMRAPSPRRRRTRACRQPTAEASTSVRSADLRFRQGEDARSRATLSRGPEHAHCDGGQRALRSARGLWRLHIDPRHRPQI